MEQRVPHGLPWMAFGAALGLVFLVIAALVAYYAWTHATWGLIVPSIGMLAFGCLFLIFCGDKLLSVEQLLLRRDLPCRYVLRSRLFGERESLEFPFSRIHSVGLSRSEEHRQRADSSTGHDIERVEARLRLTSPRRVIVLDVTENGRIERVRAVAEAVSAFLRVNLVPEEPAEAGDPDTAPET